VIHVLVLFCFMSLRPDWTLDFMGTWLYRLSFLCGCVTGAIPAGLVLLLKRALGPAPPDQSDRSVGPSQ
jgi:hypothetical protein